MTRCSATSKRTGQRCGNTVTGGATVCRFHGGRAPQTIAAVKRRQLAAEALSDLARMGVAVECTPIEALEAMLHEAAGNVVVLRELVAQLPLQGAVVRIDDVDTELEPQPRGGALKRLHAPAAVVVGVETGIYGRTKPDTLEAKPHVLVVMYGAERDRLARLAKDCADLGIDERRVKLAEADARRMYDAVTGALDAAALSRPQQEAFRTALASRLRSSQLA